jgi:hypothetical protein
MVERLHRRATSTTHTNALPSLHDDEWTRDVALISGVDARSLVAVLVLFTVFRGTSV